MLIQKKSTALERLTPLGPLGCIYDVFGDIKDSIFIFSGILSVVLGGREDELDIDDLSLIKLDSLKILFKKFSSS